LTSMKENGDICLTPHFDYLIEFWLWFLRLFCLI
jgi:hypothetical protein